MTNTAYNLNELMNSPIESVTELIPMHTNQKSFYHKARVITLKNGVRLLQSYSTIVAAVLPDGRFVSNGEYSPTTWKHEGEFANQYAAAGRGSTDDILGRPFDYKPGSFQDESTLNTTESATTWH